MSSHSGTIGRKRGGSGSSEYYFNVGEQMRRQRSAEWHSRHGYSSSEDEYQNTGQSSAFDTQLLAQLLLQSQQLASLDRYSSDCDTEATGGIPLYSFPRQQQSSAETQNSNSSSPVQVSVTEAIAQSGTYTHSGHDSNVIMLPSVNSRSTNPFLNAKLDSQSNSDSTSERLSSYSGSAVRLDSMQGKNDLIGVSTTTASSLSSHLLTTAVLPNMRSMRSKSGRSLNRVSSMTTSSSATSSNSNAINANNALRAGRTEREKLRFQQNQLELREFAQATSEHLASPSVCNDADANHFNIEADAESEPPPEPAPPEIPPRTQSLLMSLQKHSDYKLTYEDKGDQKHEQFIPTSQLQNQHQHKGEFSTQFLEIKRSPEFSIKLSNIPGLVSLVALNG